MAAVTGAPGAISGRELTAAAWAQRPRALPRLAAAATLNLEVSCKSPQIKCLLGGGSSERLECLSLPRVPDSQVCATDVEVAAKSFLVIGETEAEGLLFPRAGLASPNLVFLPSLSA